MISLEQVKLLESKVAKAIDYVKRVTGENRRLETTLESYQKRIDELEVLVQQFKEDQGKIEDGILSALDRLNQFEDAIEKSLSSAPVEPPPAVKAEVPPAEPEKREAEPAAPAGYTVVPEEPETEEPEPSMEIELEETEEDTEQGSGDAELDIF